MTCREAGPLLHARLDDELDMAGSALIDHHLSDCRVCGAQFAALQVLHDEIAAADLSYAPDAALERKLAARFLRERKPLIRFWSGGWLQASGMAAAVIAAAILIYIVPTLRTGSEMDAIAAEVLDNHLRALQPMHSVDVPSSDQHTVKPWFQGRTSFSPPVPDLSSDGFILAGGQLDVIRQQPAAAILYRHRQHVISLYLWPSPGEDSQVELHELGGYHLIHWRQNKMSFWAVSDVNTTDLRTFAELVRGR